MRRSIVFALLSLSPVIMLLGGYMTAEAAPITTTTTQTTTTFLTLTGSGATTLYQTITEITTVQTLTQTTYTSSRVVAVPVQVLTTVVSVVITPTGYGEGSGCTPDGVCVTNYYTYYGTGYVTQVGVVIVYSPTLSQSTMTSQYMTSVPTMTSSTTASTSTYTTGQVVSVTNTQTFTIVTEQAQIQPPAPSLYDMFSQNLLVALVLIGLVLGGLGYMVGRGRGTRSAVSRPTVISAAEGFCVNCGTPLKPGAKFCGKCGLST